MKENDDRITGVEEGTRPSMTEKALLFSALPGGVVGFLIAASVVVVLQGVNSGIDGMTALNEALRGLVPALVLLVGALVMRRNARSRGGVSKTVSGLCGLLGLVGAGRSGSPRRPRRGW